MSKVKKIAETFTKEELLILEQYLYLMKCSICGEQDLAWEQLWQGFAARNPLWNYEWQKAYVIDPSLEEVEAAIKEKG